MQLPALFSADKFLRVSAADRVAEQPAAAVRPPARTDHLPEAVGFGHQHRHHDGRDPRLRVRRHVEEQAQSPAEGDR